MTSTFHALGRVLLYVICGSELFVIGHCSAKDAEKAPPELQKWLKPQDWQRSSEQPIISLGEAGKFDDTHLFAPTVIYENGEYWLYYCGSQRTPLSRSSGQGKASPANRNTPSQNSQNTLPNASPPAINKDGYDPTILKERLFRLGLAKSKDGVHFTKFNDGNPIFDFGDGKHSILTPTILRRTDGTVVRENGKMRMWFTAVDFPGDYRHNIHETTSADGIHWSAPSPPVLKNAYAPCVLKDGDIYRMWFCNPARHPWHIGGAESKDGVHWTVYKQPCVQLDQAWESHDLVYSSVVKVDDAFVMIYGGYWKNQFYTALGMAASRDGLTWTKNPNNPVFKPEPSHNWESNFTTSQSLIRLPDGSWRLWYASRMAPPFTNLYFAIGTARWEGPDK